MEKTYKQILRKSFLSTLYNFEREFFVRAVAMLEAFIKEYIQVRYFRADVP